ncbi:MAG: hypothetical protein ABIO82_07385, partial [Ginsengibacter sp.]
MKRDGNSEFFHGARPQHVFEFYLPFLLIIVMGIFVGCARGVQVTPKLIWNKDFPVIGSLSSPRTTDLNGDGVLDIVMGAGKNELQKTDMGILAIDGKTGKLLWKQSAIDQMYGSATFYDVTGDGVKDIFIGGRSPQFKALDGETGSLLWDYDPSLYANHPVMHYAHFNSNNSVLVPDQNGDGLNDILTINGGNP